jgi:hypothetical protein
MLRRAEPRSRTSWCQSFRATREIRSFRHIADQRINASHHSVAVRHAHAQSAPINQKVLWIDR